MNLVLLLLAGQLKRVLAAVVLELQVFSIISKEEVVEVALPSLMLQIIYSFL
jgi:hypothetical protein